MTTKPKKIRITAELPSVVPPGEVIALTALPLIKATVLAALGHHLAGAILLAIFTAQASVVAALMVRDMRANRRLRRRVSEAGAEIVN